MKEINKLNDMEALLEELSEESTLLDDKSGAIITDDSISIPMCKDPISKKEA